MSDPPGDTGSFLLGIPGAPLQPRFGIAGDTAAPEAGQTGTRPVVVRTARASAPPFLKGTPSQGQEAGVHEAGLAPGLEEPAM